MKCTTENIHEILIEIYKGTVENIDELCRCFDSDIAQGVQHLPRRYREEAHLNVCEEVVHQVLKKSVQRAQNCHSNCFYRMRSK
jgi:hypothetical protein